jgi:methylornithine synthase
MIVNRMKKNRDPLENILSKALQEEQLSSADILFLLDLNKAEQLNMLFAAATSLRRKYFGNTIFTYGFIYASTYCRNDCRFCFFRRSNSDSHRYRKAKPEIIATARRLADSGVHLIDLTMGEDPALFNSAGAGFDRLVDLATAVARETGLPIMVSAGVIPEDLLRRLAESGVTWYACYQETHNRKLFHQLRPAQSYDIRLETKRIAHRLNLLIEEGLLCGVGETSRDIARSLKAMQDLYADQIRVMNFVPQPGTPMESRRPANPQREMVISAVMRLVFPNRLIPASLDVDGIDGLKQRLDAGANVVTSIVQPGEGLAGVAQHALDIEDGKRTQNAVLKVLKTCELRSATHEEYMSWIKSRQTAIGKHDSRRKIAC